MSVGEHTTGPWHRNIAPATRYPVIFAGQNTHVASVLTGARHGKTLSDAEIEANCNLIVAAPEMLSIIEALVAMVEDAMAGCVHRDAGAFVPGFTDLELRPDGSLKLSDARAVIARAKGRAHG